MADSSFCDLNFGQRCITRCVGCGDSLNATVRLKAWKTILHGMTDRDSPFSLSLSSDLKRMNTRE